MAASANQRTVTIQRTDRAGRTMTQEIHLLKWQGGDKPKGMQNAWRKKGWELVPQKTVAPPKEVKAAKEVEA